MRTNTLTLEFSTSKICYRKKWKQNHLDFIYWMCVLCCHRCCCCYYYYHINLYISYLPIRQMFSRYQCQYCLMWTTSLDRCMVDYHKTENILYACAIWTPKQCIKLKFDWLWLWFDPFTNEFIVFFFHNNKIKQQRQNGTSPSNGISRRKKNLNEIKMKRATTKAIAFIREILSCKIWWHTNI